MSNHLNDELLSAYLDNEVTPEERARVERALADSADTRRSLESLRQVQASLQAMPRLALPADFHDRVVQEVERRSAATAVAASTVRPADSATWRRYAGFAAMVAAVLLVAVLIAVRQRNETIVEVPAPGETEIVEIDPPSPRDDIVLPGEDTVLPGEDTVLPGDDIVAVGERQDQQLIMVLDLAITKRGQDADIFGKELKKAGVTFDPGKEGVQLDAQQQKALLATQYTAELEAEGRVNERFDVVDMVYIQATGDQIDAFKKAMDHDKQARAVLKLALDPDPLRVFNSIGRQTWSLAKADGKRKSYAYRVNIGIALYSNRSGFLAKFPTAGLEIKLDDGSKGESTGGFSFPLPVGFGAGQPKQKKVEGENEVEGQDEPIAEVPIFEVLVIRRNLNAGFPKNAQKPDPK